MHHLYLLLAPEACTLRVVYGLAPCGLPAEICVPESVDVADLRPSQQLPVAALVQRLVVGDADEVLILEVDDRILDHPHHDVILLLFGVRSLLASQAIAVLPRRALSPLMRRVVQGCLLRRSAGLIPE